MEDPTKPLNIDDCDLSRDIKIHICRDGTFTYRSDDEPVFNGVAIPVYSVDTKEEAERLQTLMCSRNRLEHPLLPDQPWMYIAGFGGELEDLNPLAIRMNEIYMNHIRS